MIYVFHIVLSAMIFSNININTNLSSSYKTGNGLESSQYVKSMFISIRSAEFKNFVYRGLFC